MRRDLPLVAFFLLVWCCKALLTAATVHGCCADDLAPQLGGEFDVELILNDDKQNVWVSWGVGPWEHRSQRPRSSAHKGWANVLAVGHVQGSIWYRGGRMAQGPGCN